MSSSRPAYATWAFWKLPSALALVVLLVVFILGHVWTAGTIWNHVTGARFSPWTNYVSDYAYRSPVWCIFVGCMYGLAAILAGLSLSTAFGRSNRRFLAWLYCSLLAYSALKLCEVALFPVKPPEVTAEEIQSRLDASSWQRLKDELYGAGIKITGGQVGRSTSAQEAIWGFQSNANHLLGITPAMLMIFVSMVLCPFLEPAKWKSPATLGLLIVALLLVVGASPGLRTFGDKVGLAQRVGFVGVYLWLWLNWVVVFRNSSAEPKEVIS
ncbi:MAG: DUF998 domain-containing protein [Verrucomicrobiaceae bacterium]|nr:MAG: DUF998 domain-containing protein [Verrucomicrobiaceae bacterium]